MLCGCVSAGDHTNGESQLINNKKRGDLVAILADRQADDLLMRHRIRVNSLRDW